MLDNICPAPWIKSLIDVQLLHFLVDGLIFGQHEMAQTIFFILHLCVILCWD